MKLLRVVLIVTVVYLIALVALSYGPEWIRGWGQ